MAHCERRLRGAGVDCIRTSFPALLDRRARVEIWLSTSPLGPPGLNDLDPDGVPDATVGRVRLSRRVGAVASRSPL